MPISAIQMNGISPVNSSGVSSGSPSGAVGFAKFLDQAIGQANNLTNQADQLSAEYAVGGPISVDQVMIAEQKASLALNTVVQVRDRVVTAYQSIMNMQV